ncbi:carbamoyl phosphate synthase [Virgibacillus dokdonensis]|uniref:Carbamoyl phosphate synthase n=1 Tax=Virgibacillus dokdonensis TaxID=302167 RepID=A0A3E0WKR1_9BACI|nr:carbamoyl phosphate synthase [Virgibacillus dokdonensis]
MNVLILSCGTRNKIVQYFKKELDGTGLVIATDCSALAPALYDADKHYIVPRMDDENYLDVILSICKENSVKAVFSLIDPELSLLAEHKQSFLDIGTVPIVSDTNIVEMCFDKYAMANFLRLNGFNIINSYIDKEAFYRDVESGFIEYPVFVKPVKGSASLNINVVTSKEEIELLFDRFDNLMIQEYMNGTEYGVDAYIDMISGEPVAIFIKEKLKMRAGETDKSISVKNEEIFDLVEKLINLVGFKGIIDVDIFEVGGKYYISEVNPRFGGGYPHAYECGVNIPYLIINNINETVNVKPSISEYLEGAYMMKYNEIMTISL